MIFIWGSKVCEDDVSSGEFYCPRCMTIKRYTRKEVCRRFTLYFIPLWKTEDLGEVVECRACGQGYKPEILNHQAVRALAIKKYLGNRP